MDAVVTIANWKPKGPNHVFPRAWDSGIILNHHKGSPNKNAHRIHGTGILPTWIVGFYGFHLGRYTSPMDPSWDIKSKVIVFLSSFSKGRIRDDAVPFFFGDGDLFVALNVCIRLCPVHLGYGNDPFIITIIIIIIIINFDSWSSNSSQCIIIKKQHVFNYHLLLMVQKSQTTTWYV